MSEHKIEENQTMYSLIKIIQTDVGSEVTFVFGKSVDVYEFASNLRILKEIAEEYGKTLTFKAENPKHSDYIENINNDYADMRDESVNLNATEADTKRRGISLSGIFGRFKKRKPLSDYSPSTGGSVGVGRSKKAKMVLLPLGILGAFAGLLFAMWWYLPSARVDIEVNSNVMVKLITVKASVGQKEVSAESSVIPAFKVEVTETDSQTIPTSGVKETGEKAKGKVTLVNKTDKEITIKKGTTVKLITTEGESLKYKTTDEVKIDARTQDDPAAEPVYGRKDVKVEAETYGDKYNLGSDQKFEVGDYDTDELIAENKEDFNGGSVEEIHVVSQEDIDSLKRGLTEFMNKKVKSSMQRKTVEGQVLQESSIKFTPVSADYSAKLDDESDELTLTMTVTGVGLAYKTGDLDSIVKDLVKTVIPAEFDLDPNDDVQYEVAVQDTNDENVLELQVKLRSYITPKLDENKIRSDLTGMSLDQADSYLNNLPNIKDFNIMLSPKMPPILQRMPQRESHIEINVQRQ